MVKNPSSNAGDMGFIPFGGTTIPHALVQLSPHTLEPSLASDVEAETPILWPPDE